MKRGKNTPVMSLPFEHLPVQHLTQWEDRKCSSDVWCHSTFRMLSSSSVSVKDTVCSHVLFSAIDDLNPLFNNAYIYRLMIHLNMKPLPCSQPAAAAQSEKPPPCCGPLMQFHVLQFCTANHHRSQTPTQQLVHLLFSQSGGSVSLFRPVKCNSRC